MVLSASFASRLVLFVALAIEAIACSSVFAEVNAVINGPTEAKVGDLVVLNGRESKGSNWKWVEPQKIQTLLCGDGMDLAFATGTPGTYQFMLIVADETAAIDYVQHTVVVRGALPEQPEPEPEPEPAPGDFEELRQLSKQLAQRQADKPTAIGLAQAIRTKASEIQAMCERNQCPTLDGAKRLMVVAIENHLLSRPNSGGWAPNWREPINAALKQANTSTVATYLTAMRAIALGLEES